jgi:hypothetical protein
LSDAREAGVLPCGFVMAETKRYMARMLRSMVRERVIGMVGWYPRSDVVFVSVESRLNVVLRWKSVLLVGWMMFIYSRE